MNRNSSTQTQKESHVSKEAGSKHENVAPSTKSFEKSNGITKLLSKSLLSTISDLCRCLTEDDDLDNEKTTQSSQRQVLQAFPEKKNKKTLALEVDQVMIFATYTEISKSNIAIKFETDNNSNQQIFVYIRPGLTEFLAQMAQIYEVIVYTSGNRKFLEPLIGFLDENNVISSKFYREDCCEIDGKPTKDLQRLNCDPKDVIFVKTSANSPVKQAENCLEIPPYEGPKADNEFAKLANLLFVMKDLSDVRPCESWRNQQRPKNSQVQAITIERKLSIIPRKLLSLKELPTLEDQESPMLKRGIRTSDKLPDRTDKVASLDDITCSSKLMDKENGSNFFVGETSLLSKTHVLSS